MVVVIGVRILLSQFYLDPEFLTSFNLVGAIYMRHMPVKVVAFNFILLLVDISCFKYSWHCFSSWSVEQK